MKVLFIVSDFDMGGITSSLRNLTNKLVEKNVEVEILNLPNKLLPQGFHGKIKLLEVCGLARFWNLGIEHVKQAKGLKKIKLLLLGFLKKLLNKKEAWFNFIFRNLQLSTYYDAVVGFRQSPICYYLTTRKDFGKKKIGFWHGDIDYMKGVSSWDYYLKELDVLACVSNAIRDQMIEKYPHLQGKAYTIYNGFDLIEIKQKQQVSNPCYCNSMFNIVTVSRLEFELKQVQRIPYICEKLLEQGITNFCWHIVGDGPDFSRLQTIIEEKALKNYIIIHGAKSNPYPYMSQADLFVLTSATESYGMVLVEALICKTPVIAGGYPALKEIVEDGKTGIIAENSIDGIYKSVYRMITDKALYNEIKKNVIQYQYDEQMVYKQFMEMMENA